MNELQRQIYLSIMGIESYVPRWHLASAPVSIACVMPDLPGSSIDIIGLNEIPNFGIPAPSLIENQAPSALLDSLIATTDARKKSVSLQIDATTILQQFEEKKSPTIQPFSLSIWRPIPGFLIIDTRNTKLALPTEVLLGNILRTFLGSVSFILDEEIMRWPMIENRFVPRTECDARSELQTWLAVENELRPINSLWLMGENAANYFLPKDMSWVDTCWQRSVVDTLSIQAFILPSLNSLLQDPQKKAKLWACV